MLSWYYMPMELFERKGDWYQAITPQSNMGPIYETLLIAILRMIYIKSGIHICGLHSRLEGSVKRQFYAGNKRIIRVVLGQITHDIWDGYH